MALDFPANPIDGEVFGSYVWSASTGVWKAREEQAPVTITSPTVPTTGQDGDLWFNTTNGLIFAYYSDGSSGQWVEVLSSAVPTISEIVPAGTIVQSAGISAPDGWLLCEGQSISRTQYSRLYTAIGTLYGSGDGTTTFNVPDLRGRVPVGKNSGTFSAIGLTGGSESVTLTAAQSGLPAHSHANTLSDPGHFHNTSHNHTIGDHAHGQVVTANSGGPAIRRDWSSDGSSFTYAQGAGTFGSGTLTTSTVNPQSTTKTTGLSISNANNTAANASQAHTNLQPYIVLNYMIRV